MLYLVPTPIGNLEDITLRAIRILKEVDLILAEDTRESAKLLKHFEIGTPMQSFHQHNEHLKTAHYVNEMLGRAKIALISDAGSPGISDPGFLLCRACVENEVEVCSLPGPTALIPALASSGIPCDKFVFEGFLPVKKGRQKRLTLLAEENRTIVLYESPHRIAKTFAQLAEFLGPNRQACLAREISKKFESYYRGSLEELKNITEKEKLKGEMVIIIAGVES